MASTPNSIEVQIDNFLEQFKRSASKAMEGDWSSSSSTTAVTTPQSAGSGPKIRNIFSEHEVQILASTVSSAASYCSRAVKSVVRTTFNVAVDAMMVFSLLVVCFSLATFTPSIESY